MSEGLGGRLISICLIVFGALLCNSCRSEEDILIQEAIDGAGSNAVELRKVLGQYDGEKASVARYLIASMPLQRSRHGYYKVPLSEPLHDKYLRLFRKNNSICYMGEIIISRDSLALDMLNLIQAEGVSSTADYGNLVDKNILSFKDCFPSDGDMIFRIETDEDIDNIFILPHNDDNYVVAGQIYELCYRTEESWVPVGRKVSDGFNISFTAPEGAVYLLRNLTKGREEQVFIWDDGRQKFNIDL